jgi:hypothetical protein
MTSVSARREGMPTELGSRDELQRADVAANGPVAVNIDSTIPELVPARARVAVARINRRTVGEQRNVVIASLARPGGTS